MKNGFRIRAVGKKAAEVYLYDEIGGMWGGISAKQVADELKALGKVDTLQVRMNSPGGDVFDGVAIFNTLKRHPAAVEVHVDGMALSIASIIAMAGDQIQMADNAMMMIHDPWTIAMGSADEFRKKADLMDQVKQNLVDTYAARTGLDTGRISALMSEETWLTAKDAEQLGFADSVTEALQVAAKFDPSRFRHAPAHLVATAPHEARGNVYRAKLADLERRAKAFGAFPR